jgi:predicted hotdog family 3-hydroxylacyl-ACP dehydratase
MSASVLAITKEGIAEIIPHAGNMCLLDGVVRWDARSICCVTASHRDLNNPLRVNGRLCVISGIEYAAQAMAAHGALAGSTGNVSRTGYLASVRDTVCHGLDLDKYDVDLTIEARKVFGEGDRVLYEFTVRAGGTLLLEGRAAVILNVTGIAS